MNKTIVLLKEHTHAGVKRAPGTILSLEARTADWLVEQGKARYQPGAQATPAKAQGITKRGCCGGRW